MAQDPEPAGGSREAGRRLLHGQIALAILVALVVGLLLAVPGLEGVADTVGRMNGWWVAAAVGLEILSCLGYVLAFLQVFERAPIRFGARVALSELAFNAAVSLGGVSSVAMGGWLLVERGAPLGRVAERSAVLFLLTSAINVITFIIAGLALFAGVSGAGGDGAGGDGAGGDGAGGDPSLLLSLLPAAIGTVVFVFFLLLPKIIDRGLDRRLPPRLRAVLKGTAISIRDTWQLLRRPDWRIVGAIGYLWFDIAVLVACFAALGATPPLATLVYHAIALWIPAMWGTLAFVLLRFTRREPLELRPTREERRRIRAGHADSPAGG